MISNNEDDIVRLPIQGMFLKALMSQIYLTQAILLRNPETPAPL